MHELCQLDFLSSGLRLEQLHVQLHDVGYAPLSHKVIESGLALAQPQLLLDGLVDEELATRTLVLARASAVASDRQL